MPFADNDRVRIHYETDGSGPPLLLHIGFAGALEDWADAGYVAALRGSFHLILLDPRGQGQSDRPHDAAAYAVQHRVGDVLAVLDAVGAKRAHFWGYSMGGWVGFALGVFAPIRIKSLVIGGAHPFQGNPRSTEGDWMLDGVRRGMASFVAECESTIPDFWVSSDERARWLAADADALAAAQLNTLTQSDLGADTIAAIQTPTLLYAGTLDEPEAVQRAAALMPNASFASLAGLDHAQGFSRSDLVLPRALAFLPRLENASAARR